MSSPGRSRTSDPGQAFVYMMYAMVFIRQFDKPDFCPCPNDYRLIAWTNMNCMIELILLEVEKCTVGSRRTSAGG